MRWSGRIAPGSCGAVRTGHAVFFRPAFTALTSARLSFFVRPLMVGTTTGGSFGAESLPATLAVLEAAPEVVDPEVVETDAIVDDATDGVAGGTSPPGDGCASLAAAQARAAAAVKQMSGIIDRYLKNSLGCISCRVDGIRREGRHFFLPLIHKSGP